LDSFLYTAVTAAKNAGKYIQGARRNLVKVDHKGRADLVTNVDKTSEQMIVSHILNRFPDHAILAEENQHTDSQSEYVWVIDPLDGTTNYVHGYQHYAVSIALQQKNKTIVGVVYNPWQDELYTAVRGKGAFLNDEPIHVSETGNLSDSMVATGIPYEIGESWHRSMQLFQRFYAVTHGVRRDGSAALDLCYVAAGRFDGFWEFELHPWDVAAGILIVQEAGGIATNLDSQASGIHDTFILGTNPKIHPQMLQTIREVKQNGD